MTERAPASSAGDRFALYDLFATYGALIDAAEFDAWLALFDATCAYTIMPRENYERGLPAGLVYCDSRGMLEDRIRALRDANKYNIHTDRHLIGLPRFIREEDDVKLVEAPFAVYQTDQEGETRLFATGVYRDHIVAEASGLKFRDKLVLLDTFAVPSLLATPL
jgi:3-phenylpropionate/cinnamic acid dioxygenase small subunit